MQNVAAEVQKAAEKFIPLAKIELPPSARQSLESRDIDMKDVFSWVSKDTKHPLTIALASDGTRYNIALSLFVTNILTDDQIKDISPTVLAIASADYFCGPIALDFTNTLRLNVKISTSVKGGAKELAAKVTEIMPMALDQARDLRAMIARDCGVPTSYESDQDYMQFAGLPVKLSAKDLGAAAGGSQRWDRFVSAVAGSVNKVTSSIQASLCVSLGAAVSAFAATVAYASTVAVAPAVSAYASSAASLGGSGSMLSLKASAAVTGMSASATFPGPTNIIGPVASAVGNSVVQASQSVVESIYNYSKSRGF